MPRGAGDAALEGGAVAADGYVDHAGAVGAGDVLGAVGAAVVGDDDLAGDAAAGQVGLGPLSMQTARVSASLRHGMRIVSSRGWGAVCVPSMMATMSHDSIRFASGFEMEASADLLARRLGLYRRGG